MWPQGNYLRESEREEREHVRESSEQLSVFIQLFIRCIFRGKKKKENPCEEVGLSIFIYQWLKTP